MSPDRPPPADRDSLKLPKPNLLERKASDYLKALSRKNHGAPGVQPLAAALLRVEQRAIVLAIVAGLISGGLIGSSEVFVLEVLLEDVVDKGWLANWGLWAVFFVFVGIISVLEILFLYWNAFRAINRITTLAGSKLRGHAHTDIVVRGLARSGLELPNPRGSIFGIDPYERVPSWRLTAFNILYKLKVGASSLVLRLFLRRVFGRMLVRGFIPLLAGPLYAIWNAVITWRISQEAKVRTFGPIAVENVLAEVMNIRDRLSPTATNAVLQGVGELLLRGQDAHPNFIFLLLRLREETEFEGYEIKVDWEKVKQSFPDLDKEEQTVVMAIWTLAGVLGSKTSKQQVAFLQTATEAGGWDFDKVALVKLRRRLLQGETITRRALEAVQG